MFWITVNYLAVTVKFLNIYFMIQRIVDIMYANYANYANYVSLNMTSSFLIK